MSKLITEKERLVPLSRSSNTYFDSICWLNSKIDNKGDNLYCICPHYSMAFLTSYFYIDLNVEIYFTKFSYSWTFNVFLT